MDEKKRKRLETAGFKFGTVGELFQLSKADEGIIEMKVALAASVRELRGKKGMSQTDLAKQLESGQARVSKIEKADPSVSLDLMVRAALVLGASPRQVAHAMTGVGRSGGSETSVRVEGTRLEPASRRQPVRTGMKR